MVGCGSQADSERRQFTGLPCACYASEVRAASLIWVLVLTACGGRTFDDAIYDEGVAQGGSANATSGGKSGGRKSSGGVTGAGGAGTGAVSSGGAATTRPESCRRFCKQLVNDCGIALKLNDTVCRSSCEESFTVGSTACDSLRFAALGCIENALAQPMTTCDDMSRILTSDCLIPVGLWANCVR